MTKQEREDIIKTHRDCVTDHISMFVTTLTEHISTQIRMLQTKVRIETQVLTRDLEEHDND